MILGMMYSMCVGEFFCEFFFFTYVGIVFDILCIYEVRCIVPDPMLAASDKINCLFS